MVSHVGPKFRAPEMGCVYPCLQVNKKTSWDDTSQLLSNPRYFISLNFAIARGTMYSGLEGWLILQDPRAGPIQNSLT